MLIGYRYHPESGKFEELQTAPALPSDFTGENLCADIHISPDGGHEVDISLPVCLRFAYLHA
jgi:6-phosphogluconolactonase (cycloisomerase 2 family)